MCTLSEKAISGKSMLIPHKRVKNALPRPEVKTTTNKHASQTPLLHYRQCNFCKGKYEQNFRSHRKLKLDCSNDDCSKAKLDKYRKRWSRTFCKVQLDLPSTTPANITCGPAPTPQTQRQICHSGRRQCFQNTTTSLPPNGSEGEVLALHFLTITSQKGSATIAAFLSNLVCLVCLDTIPADYGADSTKDSGSIVPSWTTLSGNNFIVSAFWLVIYINWWTGVCISVKPS